MTCEERGLFGSSLTVEIPSSAEDISLIRQIPDNQEVFTHRYTDQSIIIEILEFVVAENDEQALRIHYEDIAKSNDTVNGESSDILYTRQISNGEVAMAECDSIWYLLAEQSVSKFNESAKNTLQLHIGLFRLSRYSADILVTLNDPLIISTESSSHQTVPVSADRWTEEHFLHALKTLRVQDVSLFGGTI